MTVAIGCAVGARCCSILLIVALPRGVIGVVMLLVVVDFV
jgi:hypothetical protein